MIMSYLVRANGGGPDRATRGEQVLGSRRDADGSDAAPSLRRCGWSSRVLPDLLADARPAGARIVRGGSCGARMVARTASPRTHAGSDPESVRPPNRPAAPQPARSRSSSGNQTPRTPASDHQAIHATHATSPDPTEHRCRTHP